MELVIWELADLRTIGRSRHNPQYEIEELAVPLQQEGIAFTQPDNL
jgi:hypothetical protein